MYAVFEDGSRQYRVSEGEFVKVDYRDADEGSRLEFNRVLMIQSNQGTEIGRPVVAGARILAEIVEHPTEKTYIQKYRRRKNYRRYVGHRQPFTMVKINQILLPGQEPAPPPSEPPASQTPASEPSGSPPAGETPATSETK